MKYFVIAARRRRVIGRKPGCNPRAALRHATRVLPFVLALLPAGSAVHAQDIPAEIDRIFSWATPTSPGCVVGIARHGEVLVNRAYGMADLERGVALTPQSVFDIGSTHKQFVAASVLLLVQDGRLALTDDIRKYIPELPDYGHTITIDNLLTHTSGIRDWVWLSQVNEARDAALTLILRQRGLNFAPGTEWAYSNSNFVLAKEIVARVSGQPFGEFLSSRVFEPLGMKSSRYALDATAVPNHALAYQQDGEQWKVDMLLGNARGGGGVFTTTADLLTWNDALTNERLGAFLSRKIQEPARLANGRMLDYARGLMIDDDGEIVWHSGSAAAYKSILARLPKAGVSLALLCNAGDEMDRRNHEVAIIDLLVPDTATSAAAAKGASDASVAVDVALPVLEKRAGLFFSERTGDPLRLVVAEGRLRVAGGPALVAVAEDRFRNPRGLMRFMSKDEFELHFISEDQFELKSMEGQVTRYDRAQSWTPDAAELAVFAGRYETDEIGTAVVTPTASGLSARLNNSPAIEFAPVHPDVFQRGAMTVRFRRDAAGAVTGLDLSNPVLRNAHFPRRGEVAIEPTPAPATTVDTEIGRYQGTYALQAPNRVIELRVWLDSGGRLNGELVGLGQQTTFRPGGPHRFLHGERDDIWFQFTVEDGRATGATMHQRGREISGPRTQ